MAIHPNISYLLLNRGTSQETKHLPALSPDHFQVDDRKMIDLLAFAIHYSAKVKFHHPTSEETSNWANFFLKDKLILLNIISNLDMSNEREQFSRAYEQVFHRSGQEMKTESLREALLVIIRLVSQIDFWKKNLAYDEDTKELVYELKDAITSKLQYSLQNIIRSDRSARAKGIVSKSLLPYYFNIEHLDPDWMKDVQLDAVAAEEPQTISGIAREIKEHYHTFEDSLSFIKEVAVKTLQTDLYTSQNNAPHIALFIAFLKMFRHEQDILNTVNKRHLDLYYRDVLKQKNRNIEPDQAFLHFEPADDSRYCEIPENTAFLAGKNAQNQDIIYRTAERLYVNHARIADVRNVFVSKNPNIYIEGKTNIVTNLFANAKPQFDDTTGEKKKKWYPFGEDQFFNGEDYRTMQDADIGFMIASSYLQLQEGEREITITFSLTADSYADFLRFLHKPNYSDDTAFQIVFRNAFHISITTDEGWKPVDYQALLVPEENGFSVTLDIPSGWGRISGQKSDIHPPGLDSHLPVVKIVLNPLSTRYAYAYLQGHCLSDITIQTRSRNLRDLVIQNELGPVAAGKPFTPFGITPLPGSHFLVGSHEAFTKNIDSLNLHIKWSGLPAGEGGFSSYFSAYPNANVTNSSYALKIQSLKDGAWFPKGKNKSYTMFSEDDHGCLRATSSITLQDGKELNFNQVHLTELLPYSTASRTGFIRAELDAPNFCFGHRDYVKAVSTVLHANAAKKKKEELLPDPNPPFNPAISEISLDYSASIRSSKSKDDHVIDFYHVHPFGYDEVKFRGDDIKTLLPDYDHEGNLYIALQHITPPENVSLLFFISDSNYYSATSSDNLRLEWSYMTENNEWKPFSNENIIRDTTNDFLKSGIVELLLPADAKSNCTILPSGLFWIRVALRSNTYKINGIVDVMTNGGLVTWEVIPGDESHVERKLPAGSIKATKEKIPGLKKIYQPMQSFGGRASENENQYYQRVSERLRHRRKAVSIWDYEHLVLEQFPDIAFAKCFPANASHPGKVTIVVIPKIEDVRFVNPYRPRASTTKLSQIRSYLLQFTSSFVDIDVINPFYERVKVVCNVLFNAEGNQGTYLNQLDQDLKGYLSPWLSSKSYDDKLGRHIYRSDVLAYIQKRPYVDYVTGFSLVKTVDEVDEGFKLDDTARNEGHSKLEISYPWSIITSANNHDFKLLPHKHHLRPEKRGIGNLEMGSDFILTNDLDPKED